jgi:hypothetical protein
LTAINALALGSRAYLLTDTAAYRFDGVVRHFVSKVATLSHLGCALATRGALPALQAAVEALRPCISFDEVVSTGPALLSEAYEAGEFDPGGGSEAEFDLVLAGYSTDRRRAEAHTLSSLQNGDVPPFTLQRLDLIMAPAPDAGDLVRAGIIARGQFRAPDPAAGLLRIMKIQRVTPGPAGSALPDSKEYVVGGAAVLTEITAAGTLQRVLHRWDDTIGKKIQPTEAERLAAFAKE